MKFFVSGANDEADAERVYQTVKEFVAKQTMPLEDRRIFSITYMHDGTRYHAEIGKPML